jgi:hypothetical protein
LSRTSTETSADDQGTDLDVQTLYSEHDLGDGDGAEVVLVSSQETVDNEGPRVAKTCPGRYGQWTIGAESSG